MSRRIKKRLETKTGPVLLLHRKNIFLMTTEDGEQRRLSLYKVDVIRATVENLSLRLKVYRP